MIFMVEASEGFPSWYLTNQLNVYSFEFESSLFVSFQLLLSFSIVLEVLILSSQNLALHVYNVLYLKHSHVICGVHAKASFSTKPGTSARGQ